jgi:hypothetical protein
VQELKPLRVTFLSEDGRVPEEGVDQGGAYTIYDDGGWTHPSHFHFHCNATPQAEHTDVGMSILFLTCAGAEEAASCNLPV